MPTDPATKVERIDGWKSIAAYFGRDRTTVVRWARERGLPVHRLPGGQTGTVYALRHELDRWAGLRERDAGPAEAAAPPAAAPPHRLAFAGRTLIAVLGLMVLAAIVGIMVLRPAAPAAVAPLPGDPRVARAYLAARDLVAERSAGSIERGLGLLERVVAADPGYAPAQVALGEALILSREFGVRGDREAFDRARSAARTALRLAPELPAAERLTAFIAYWADGDFREADTRFRRALARDGGDTITSFWYGNVLSDHGDHAAALAMLDRARLMQPGSPAIRTDLAWARWAAGDRGAVAELADLSRRYPDFAVVHECLALIAYLHGDRAGYVDQFARLARVRGDPRLLAESAQLRGARDAAAIDRVALDQALAALAQDRARSHVWAIVVATAMRDRARVVALLSAAERRRERWGEAALVSRVAAHWRADRDIRALIAQRVAE